MSGHVPENLPVFEPAHSHSHHADHGHHAEHDHHDTHAHAHAVAHHAPTWVDLLNTVAAPIWWLTGDFQNKEDDHGHHAHH